MCACVFLPLSLTFQQPPPMRNNGIIMPRFKVMASAMQVNGVAAVLFDWATYFDSFLVAQEHASSFGIAYFKLACLAPGMEGHFVLESVLYALMPGLLLLVLACVMIAAKCCTREGQDLGKILLDIKVELFGVGIVVCVCAL